MNQCPKYAHRNTRQIANHCKPLDRAANLKSVANPSIAILSHREHHQRQPGRPQSKASLELPDNFILFFKLSTHRWMSSHSSHRCSEQHRTSNRTQKWASLNLRFCSNHGGRRKDNANICSNSMASSDSAQRLALVAAAVCAGVIQMYTPVPQQVPPSFSMDHLGTTLLLGHSSRLDIVRGWVEGRLGELLRKSSRSQALERTVVMNVQPSQLSVTDLSTGTNRIFFIEPAASSLLRGMLMPRLGHILRPTIAPRRSISGSHIDRRSCCGRTRCSCAKRKAFDGRQRISGVVGCSGFGR